MCVECYSRIAEKTKHWLPDEVVVAAALARVVVAVDCEVVHVVGRFRFQNVLEANDVPPVSKRESAPQIKMPCSQRCA